MRRILVVDDDPHICLAVRAWLKRYGFKVEIADGGAAGLAAFDNSTFDQMIVDVFMPDMRGFESISTFHDHAPAVPLIAISGYAFSGLEGSSPDLSFDSNKGERVACIPIQEFQNFRKPTVSPGEPICHVSSSSMTIQWSAWRSKSISNGTTFGSPLPMAAKPGFAPLRARAST
jgi:CheY-like chemotaxis protein